MLSRACALGLGLAISCWGRGHWRAGSEGVHGDYAPFGREEDGDDKGTIDSVRHRVPRRFGVVGRVPLLPRDARGPRSVGTLSPTIEDPDVGLVGIVPGFTLQQYQVLIVELFRAGLPRRRNTGGAEARMRHD
jgi:hypothetical protein